LPAVPVVFCIDVEPDEFLIARQERSTWTGFAAMVGIIEELRHALEDATNDAQNFLWFLRMDPQIRAVHGRADYVVDAFAERLARLQDKGDLFGSHVHALRWDEPRGRWCHDFADPDWVAHCLDSSFEAFAGAFGHTPPVHRSGGAFLTNDIVGLLERWGVSYDLTIEPGPRLAANPFAEVPMKGKLPDYQRVPTTPYRPSRADFRRADKRGREVMMVPLSSTRRRLEERRGWRAAQVVSLGRRPRLAPLFMWRGRPGPDGYWDLVARHLASMRRPLLAIAVRTDMPDSEVAARVRGTLERLPRHPLARHLRLVDPGVALKARAEGLSPDGGRSTEWRAFPPGGTS
jgi:hypothetical protein